MNSYTNGATFDALQGHGNYITAYHPSHLVTALHQALNHFVNWLTAGSMPHISKVVRGNTETWKVYDPTVGRTLYFVQEDDLRVWMEERYYQ
ncbi:MAG TPA: hypothetical protein V6D02_07350 [Candidatus Obscuribacterales bacterium]